MVLIRCLAALLLLSSATPLHAQARAVTARIGVLDGPPQLVFGTVTDVVLTEEYVVVLDGSARNVRMFTRQGQFVAGAGRAGSGPGEFRDPVALAAHGDRLYVLDRALQRITVLLLRDRRLQLHSTFRLDFAASDLCVGNNRVHVLGLWRDRIVHVFNAEGKLEGSFGDPPPSEYSLLRASLSDGLIACAASGEVAVMFKWLPLLRIYRGGRLVIDRQLPEYKPIEITQRANGMLLWARPATGVFHYAAGLWFEGAAVWAQAGEVRKDSHQDDAFAAVLTYNVATSPQQEVKVRTDLPWLSEIMGHSGVGMQREPFPAVLLYDARRFGTSTTSR